MVLEWDSQGSSSFLSGKMAPNLQKNINTYLQHQDQLAVFSPVLSLTMAVVPLDDVLRGQKKKKYTSALSGWKREK